MGEAPGYFRREDLAREVDQARIHGPVSRFKELLSRLIALDKSTGRVREATDYSGSVEDQRRAKAMADAVRNMKVDKLKKDY